MNSGHINMNDNTQREENTLIIDRLHESLSADKPDIARELLMQMHPSEIADVLESLPLKAREAIWCLINPKLEGDVLSELHDTVRAELLEQMQPQEVVEVTRDLDTDDVADIIQGLPEEIQDSVLRSMDEQNRQRLASVLSYPEDTAGRMMNTDVISVRADVSLDVVMRYLRLLGQIPENTDNLMVVDRENNYLGILALANVLIKDPESSVGENMTGETGIPAQTPANEVAKIFEQRDLVSAAVVDEKNILLGRITVDDVVDVIQEEADYTLRSMAGVTDEDMFTPVLWSVRRRVAWLCINLATASLAAWVVGRFQETIAQLVILAVLMPIVANMGGVAGSQTLTITIRGIALGQLSKSNTRSLLLKEIGVALLNGLVLAAVVTLIAIAGFDQPKLGLIVGLAMVLNLFTASLAGTLIPLGLKHFGIDPAVAGGMLLTTVTDAVGFFTFLGLATLLLV
ncbi:MAG: magnesium transporter [Gammaproteobacteria bacterium]|nr:magnesium transporter [Gammaproteobacteria bacterium]